MTRYGLWNSINLTPIEHNNDQIEHNTALIERVDAQIEPNNAPIKRGDDLTVASVKVIQAVVTFHTVSAFSDVIIIVILAFLTVVWTFYKSTECEIL